MNWLLIVLIVAALFMLLKFAHIKHKIFLFAIIALFLFLTLSVGIVSKTEGLDTSTPSGVIEAGKVYFVWIVIGLVLKGEVLGVQGRLKSV